MDLNHFASSAALLLFDEAGERTLTILAFAEEQAVLAALDRKGSNPASRRLVGQLYRPEDQRRLDAIMARLNPTIDA